MAVVDAPTIEFVFTDEIGETILAAEGAKVPHCAVAEKQSGMGRTAARDRITCRLPLGIDVVGATITAKSAQVGHFSVAIDKGMGGATGRLRGSDHLARVVDIVGGAGGAAQVPRSFIVPAR